MCLKMGVGNGKFAIICGVRGLKPKFCACGRESHLLCDWKVKDKKSGTCDAPICDQHALQVGTDKHLCPLHQKAWEAWQKRHPGAIPPPDYSQLALL
jgi:hypothetical protein